MNNNDLSELESELVQLSMADIAEADEYLRYEFEMEAYLASLDAAEDAEVTKET